MQKVRREESWKSAEMKAEELKEGTHTVCTLNNSTGYSLKICDIISNCVMNDDAIWMAGWVPSQFKVVFEDSNYLQI